jgi:glycosyltransferase involved in cell wall biosynthesis
MACGAAIVASDTAPVREVIGDGTNAMVTSFFDTELLADRVECAVQAASRSPLGRRAVPDDTKHYSIARGLSGYAGVVGGFVASLADESELHFERETAC